MGIYTDHGIEYHIVITSNSSPELKEKYNIVNDRIIFLSTKHTNKRLENSNYYLSRKDTWDSYKIEQFIPIDGNSIDINLTEFEIDILTDLVTDLRKDGLTFTYGWYEVANSSSTLDIRN